MTSRLHLGKRDTSVSGKIALPMKQMNKASESRLGGFTMLELLVAIAVTAMLATMLLTITKQVVVTHGQTSGSLETNQAANFILDRIQEDLHCALYRNDGGVWLAATIPEDKSDMASWKAATNYGKPISQSLRLSPSDLTDPSPDPYVQATNQLRLEDCRFGFSGAWLRFFTQAPELDPTSTGGSGVRAISYKIVRHGLTGAPKSEPRYQLFRADVSAKETFDAGYDLHPTKGTYLAGANGRRETGNVVNPIFVDNGKPSTDFSLAANIIDFGIRAYLIEPDTSGKRQLRPIFPDVNATTGPYEYFATSNPTYRTNTSNPLTYAFPDVVDIMVRVLTSGGASVIASFEEGLISSPSDVSDEEYWWQLAEENSHVYIRRIRVLASGI